MLAWLEPLLPPMTDSLLRGRAVVVTIACLALAAAIIFLLIAWKASGDLQVRTIVAGGVWLIILFVIWRAAYLGFVDVALWCLVALLFIALTLEIFVYRIEPLAGAGLVIPITIAGAGQGLMPALIVAALGSIMLWFFAYAERKGWFRRQVERRRSYLTYNAPFLTVINFLIALITGIGFEYWQHLIR